MAKLSIFTCGWIIGIAMVLLAVSMTMNDMEEEAAKKLNCYPVEILEVPYQCLKSN